jgi:hypothetical protein
VSEPIRAKVARIMNSREVVLNRGSADGVVLGTHFAILDRAGEGIVDPDTGETLGSIQRTKVEVEVTQVGDRISVAQTFHWHRINEGGFGVGLSGELARMFAPPKYVKKYETLKICNAGWEPLPDRDSIVEVGDEVVEVRGSEADAPTAGIVIRPQPPALESSPVEGPSKAVLPRID